MLGLRGKSLSYLLGRGSFLIKLQAFSQFHNIHRRKPLLGSLFNENAGLQSISQYSQENICVGVSF